MHATPETRRIDHWFSGYSSDHRDPTNQAIHVVAVPAIVWSVIALLWLVPVPGTLLRPGAWAALAMFAALLFYWRASRAIGLGMLMVFAAMSATIAWLHGALGTTGLLALAIAVFALAWLAQFIGHSHRYEGRKPSFLTDLRYLLVGPAWVLAKGFRRLGLRY